MTDLDLFIDQFGSELVGAIARRRHRHVRNQRTAAFASIAVAAAVLVALLVPGLPGGSPHTALAITSTQDSVTVRVLDAMADPAQMSDELRAAGVSVRVEAEPVEAGAVGRWIATGTLGQASPAQSIVIVRHLADQIRAHPDYLEIPKGLPFTLELVVGRPAAAGEQPCTRGGGVVVEASGGQCPQAGVTGGHSR